MPISAHDLRMSFLTPLDIRYSPRRRPISSPLTTSASAPHCWRSLARFHSLSDPLRLLATSSLCRKNVSGDGMVTRKSSILTVQGRMKRRSMKGRSCADTFQGRITAVGLAPPPRRWPMNSTSKVLGRRSRSRCRSRLLARSRGAPAIPGWPQGRAGP